MTPGLIKFNWISWLEKKAWPDLFGKLSLMERDPLNGDGGGSSFVLQSLFYWVYSTKFVILSLFYYICSTKCVLQCKFVLLKLFYYLCSTIFDLPSLFCHFCSTIFVPLSLFYYLCSTIFLFFSIPSSSVLFPTLYIFFSLTLFVVCNFCSASFASRFENT
jgi:hypothetical protein